MRKKSKLIMANITVLASTLLVAPSVSAASCGVDNNGQPISTFFNWNCPSGRDGITGIISAIFWIVSGLVAAACLGAIVFGGIRYSAANSNASAAKEGLDIIRNAVIALVLYGCFFAIVYLLVGKDVVIPR